MKRIVFSLLAFLLFTGSLQASFGFGIRGGFNFSSVPSSQDFQTNQYLYTALSDAYTGYHVGVVGQFVFTGFFIQPELIYTRTGLEMRRHSMDPVTEADLFFTQQFDHLALPVNLGAKIGPFRIGAGPVFSLLMDDSTDFPSDEEFNQELNNITMGLQAGIGLDLGNLILDFKYETSLTRFGEGVVINGQPFAFDTRPRQFILSVGLLF